MKILVTGFDPFGGETKNPALEVVKKLPDGIEGASIIKLEIPTVFGKSAGVMKEAIRKENPNYVLSIGQAGGRYRLTPERVAINLDDARIPDNEGNQPIDMQIQPDGENAYFSQLPLKAMVKAMKEAGVPASISNSAGTFVCNHIMYQTLYLTHSEYPNVKAGFIHIPFLPEQVTERPGTASMSLNDMVKGVIATIKAIIAYDGKEDLKTIGGETH
ncbi:pyroglutamyl-peptidase I [Oceanobacillus luteolus]|uniref:Pyrrolidone-carboxylate peptidase n=1 Tax=Oceanobacillus luteolus TaxID=1274358 RepID=A0ABW4HU64_9BACI|nr:pyroglutamyl-peptidase I [Oceanobacillus luteolus]MCM3741934.1 pyroglutamyl-peptidase I [Oceanobacillus luteolus]